MKFIIKLLSTGLGVGFIPIAPGTFGTLVGVGLFYLLSPLPHYIYSVTVVAFILLASWLSSFAEVSFNEKDSQKIVIDEIAGFLVAMAFHQWNLFNVVVGFALFRFFDVAKPFPIRTIDKKIKNGFGVVFDDVVAGIYANIVLIVLKLFI